MHVLAMAELSCALSALQSYARSKSSMTSDTHSLHGSSYKCNARQNSLRNKLLDHWK
jgi:hypothetical protein